MHHHDRQALDILARQFDGQTASNVTANLIREGLTDGQVPTWIAVEAIKATLDLAPPLRGPDHRGMRVSVEGLLGRIAAGQRDPDMDGSCGELLANLKEAATRFYGGEPAAVDELFQLYALDDARGRVASPLHPPVNSMAFNFALKVSWTELHNALVADGHGDALTNEAGVHVREWLEKVVAESFTQHGLGVRRRFTDHNLQCATDALVAGCGLERDEARRMAMIALSNLEHSPT